MDSCAACKRTKHYLAYMQHVLLVYDSLDRSYVDRKFSAPLACKIQMRLVNLHMQLFCVDMFPCGSFKKHLNESVLSLLSG